MSSQMVLEITRKELSALKEFLKVLKEERDDIVSFSLEGIIRGNNRKEEILKRIEFLEKERETILKDIPDRDSVLGGEGWASLSGSMRQTVKEVNEALGRNTKLLSFSMDHIRSSIENVVGFMNKVTYGKKQERVSFFPAREI
jgi:hypothetical protein